MDDMPDNLAARSDDAMLASSHAGPVNQFRFDLGARAVIISWVQLAIIVVFGFIIYLQLRDAIKVASEHSKQDAMYDERMKTLEESNLKLERQFRMTELILDDWNVTARRAGIVLPGDYAHGPQGNLDAEAYNMKGSSKP